MEQVRFPASHPVAVASGLGNLTTSYYNLQAAEVEDRWSTAAREIAEQRRRAYWRPFTPGAIHSKSEKMAEFTFQVNKLAEKVRKLRQPNLYFNNDWQ